MPGCGCFEQQAASLCEALDLGRAGPDDTPEERLTGQGPVCQGHP